MNDIADLFPKVMTPSQALKISAGISLFQAAMTAHWMFKTAKVIEKTEKQWNFMADIISRNLDNLNEFDIIALKDLGVLVDQVND